MFSKMTKYQQVKSLRERRYWEVAGFRPYLSRPSRLIFDSSVLPGNPEFRGRAGGTRNSSVAFGKSSFDDFHFEICER